MSVVTIPFIATVIGYRLNLIAVLIGMISGFTGAITWELFCKVHNIGGLVPGIVTHVVCLTIANTVMAKPKLDD